MLVAIADAGGELSYQALYERVTPGNVDEWIASFNLLMTEGLVVRISGHGCYLYRITDGGSAVIHAYLRRMDREVAS
jgi:hypothetical protein